MKCRYVSVTKMVALAFLAVGVARADITEKSPIGDASASGAVYQCPAGSAIAGFQQWRRDRLLGLSVFCVTRRQTLGALWENTEAVSISPDGLRIGAQRPSGGVSARTVCPYNFFLVGLGGETADYHENPRDGRAHVTAWRVRIADIWPVCRGPDGAVFAFPPGRLLDGTSLKSSSVTQWTAPSGCARGDAAVGLRYAYRSRRDDEAGFEFIGLLCDRVGSVPSEAAIRVEPPPQ